MRKNTNVSPVRRLLTAEDAAARLNVARWRVYELAREGKLPVVRLGKSMRFDHDALESFIAHGGTRDTDA